MTSSVISFAYISHLSNLDISGGINANTQITANFYNYCAQLLKDNLMAKKQSLWHFTLNTLSETKIFDLHL